MANEIIKTAQTAITESAIDVFITPALKKLKSVYKRKYNEYLVPKGRHFKKYLDEAYNDYSSLNTLVFHDRIKSLKEVYLPLTLVKEDKILNKQESVIVDGIPIELVKRCRKLLIIDTAGMGKSTMLKRMFLDVNDIGLNEVGIPLFVDLRRLKSDWSIIDEIEKRLSTLSETFDKELLLYLLEIGGFIFFLDGYDEISLIDKDAVTKSLQDFIKKASNNYFILTSRPENAVLGFEGFVIFNIRPLVKEEAFSLLNKYDILEDKKKSTKLINLLNSDEYKSAGEFLETPLLTTLLFNAFDYKETIPLKKHLFYRQVYDAYFENHDLKKGDSYIHDKSSGLDTDDFCRMLRYIGFHSLKNGIEYSKDEILGIIGRAKKFYGYMNPFGDSSFLKDILTAVPLFCEEGSKYKWVHKSLMEYFAAMFISEDIKNKQVDVLSKIYKSENIEKYINMLDLYCDIDPKGFSKNIIYSICNEFVSFYELIDYDKKKLPKELIEERIAYLFMYEPYILKLDDKTVEPFIKNFDNIKEFYERRDELMKKLRQENKDLKELNYEHDNFLISLGSTAYIVFFYMRTSATKVLPLLYKRSRGLFSSGTGISMASKEKLKDGVLYKVDMSTGDDRKELYNGFNNMICPRFREFHSHVYLDYSACKNEIEVIDKMMSNDEDALDITDGL